MRYIALAVLALLIAGCARPDKIMDSWIGSHQSNLIQKWGPPSYRTSDGKDGQILVYEAVVNIGQAQGRAQVDRYGNVTWTNPQQYGYTKTRMFYVNPDGIIYYWRAQGM